MVKKNTKIETPFVLESEGHQLVGIEHTGSTDKCITMCHGFTGNKIENKRLFVDAARHFAQEGCSVVRFDFYGSGDSDGEFQDTLVSHNIANLRDILIWAKKKYEKVAVLGLSLGAAVAILTINDIPVDALITWSAVPDFERLFEAHIQNPQVVAATHEIIEYDGWSIKRDFFFDAIKYNVGEALAQLTLPKFIVQGTADAPIFVDGFKQFEQIVQPPADFMEIPAAGHTFQTPAHRRQVIRQTAIWLSRHF